MEMYRELKGQHELIFAKDNSPALFNSVSSVSILMFDNSPLSSKASISNMLEFPEVRLSRPTNARSAAASLLSQQEVIDDRLSTDNFASQGDVVYRSQSQNQNQQ
jgi:hypothetical protein